MKTKNITLFFTVTLLLVLQNFSDAQAVWYTSTINTTGSHNIYKIQFVDQNTGYGCGASGTIMKTTNGGATWSNLTIGTTKALSALFFLNANTGWVGVRDDFYIRKTTDGGLTWVMQEADVLGSTEPIDIFFINAQTGYTQSVNRTFKTVNGGQQWDVINYSISAFYDLQYINESIGFALERSNLKRTYNGGVNWYDAPIFSMSTRESKCLYFLNDQTGWIAGANYIVRTTNGGTTAVKDTLPMINPTAVKFINENTGWVVGSYGGLNGTSTGMICSTTDGGHIWRTEVVSASMPYYDLAVLDINHIWVSSRSKLTTTQNVTSVLQVSTVTPEKFSLQQNFPNPFNPSTIINYQLAVNSFVTLKVYDMQGKEAASLVNEKQSAGSYAVDFNTQQFNLPSGVYFYTLNTGNFTETRKMMLVK